ncbi:hypothetical protein QYF36_007527 [Acer negundo]|nr:hypothetical protein QYF36_007527 [Acer negundo]
MIWKQSVRKVFAQGYNAKDLRQYVQYFNMSLKDRPHEKQQEEEEEETEMPNKKPKLTNSNEEGEGYDQFYKSIFSSQAQEIWRQRNLSRAGPRLIQNGRII